MTRLPRAPLPLPHPSGVMPCRWLSAAAELEFEQSRSAPSAVQVPLTLQVAGGFVRVRAAAMPA